MRWSGIVVGAIGANGLRVLLDIFATWIIRRNASELFGSRVGFVKSIALQCFSRCRNCTDFTQVCNTSETNAVNPEYRYILLPSRRASFHRVSQTGSARSVLKK
jgi:hypothetical protein